MLLSIPVSAQSSEESARIQASPTYGAPGATVSVDGRDFTPEALVELLLGETGVGYVIVEDDGTFTTTFTVPAVTFDTYTLVANTNYEIATCSFKVGIIAVIISPISGPSGNEVTVTGTGFETGTFDLTIGNELVIQEGAVDVMETLSDTFFVPTMAAGTYLITIVDEEENEISVTYIATETTSLDAIPDDIAIGCNLTLEGEYFAESENTELSWYVYNSSWSLDISELVYSTDSQYKAQLTQYGNFTAIWAIPDLLLIGNTYTINATDNTAQRDTWAEVTIIIVEEEVEIVPNMGSYSLGDTVTFSLRATFIKGGAVLQIEGPNGELYFESTFTAGVWTEVEPWWVVQIRNQVDDESGIPYIIPSDASTGTWNWILYEDAPDDSEVIASGTFEILPTTSDQVDDRLSDVEDSIADLADDIAGVTSDLEDDIDALSSEIGDVASDVDGLKDEIVGARAITATFSSQRVTIDGDINLNSEYQDASEASFSTRDGLVEMYLQMDEEYLYIAVDIDDSGASSGDQVFLGFDTNYDGTLDSKDGVVLWHGSGNWIGTGIGVENLPIPEFSHEYQLRTEGYTIEVKLPLSFFSERNVGFHIRHSPDGNQNYVWEVPGKNVFGDDYDASRYGVLYLSEYTYQLAIVSDFGSVLGEGPYSGVSSASFSVSPTTVSGESGVRYVFTGWTSTSTSGYTGIDNPATIMMNNDITQTAEWKTQYYLTVEADEYGSVSPLSNWYDEGTRVTISSIPNSGYSFESWSGKRTGSYSGTQATTIVTMNDPIIQSATFREAAKYTLTVTSAYGITSGEGTYIEGTTTPFTVTPTQVKQEGKRHTFTGWTSTNWYGYTGPGQEASVVMNGDVREKAEWETECYLTVYSDVEVDGAGWYADGSTVQLDADSPRGFLIRKVFQKWTGDIYSRDPSIAIVMKGAKSVSAEWTTDYSQAVLVGVVGAVLVGGGGYVLVQRRRREEEMRTETERVERETQLAVELRKRIIGLVERSDEVVVLEYVAKTLNVSEDKVKTVIDEAIGDGILVGRFSNEGHTFITDDIIKRIMKDKLGME